jgi:acetyl esterase/lipase
MRSSFVLLALLICSAHPLEDEQSGSPLIGEVASNKNQPAMQVKFSHLTANSTIGEVIAHPAFAGFGRLLLPWDNRKPDGNMQLREVSALLPYHSKVNPTDVVTALNRMIDDVNNGKSIFYDFYTEAQKNAEPTKRNAGLFFFRGKPGAPFAIVCPGGGFAYVASLHEGFPYAAEISRNGYNVFVLKYRAGIGGAAATQDLAAALSYVFKIAKTLGGGTDDYSLWGSSAGARMAASLGTHGAAFFGGDALPRPSVVVTAYTAHSEVGLNEPPTFAVVGAQDGIAPPYVMERRISALRRAGTPVEFHRFEDLGHGFGLGTGTSAEGWIDNAIRFWERSMHQLIV